MPPAGVPHWAACQSARQDLEQPGTNPVSKIESKCVRRRAPEQLLLMPCGARISLKILESYQTLENKYRSSNYPPALNHFQMSTSVVLRLSTPLLVGFSLGGVREKGAGVHKWSKGESEKGTLRHRQDVSLFCLFVPSGDGSRVGVRVQQTGPSFSVLFLAGLAAPVVVYHRCSRGACKAPMMGLEV